MTKITVCNIIIENKIAIKSALHIADCRKRKDILIMSKSKQKKLIGIGCIVLAVVIGVFAVIYLTSMSKNAAQVGAKTISVTVVHADTTSKEFTIKTDAETLADALLQDKVVEGTQGDYGLYITVADGETADESKQEWWCLTKGGETMTTGASETKIADGDKYEITLTKGW